MGQWQNFETENHENRAAVNRALRLRREIDDFENRWPTLAKRDECLPPISWAQLERQLVDLSATPAQADMARHLVSASRKLAAFKPAEMVLREILCMTWVLLDENFRPEEPSAATS
jgi:hypothetical protein